MVSSGDHVQRRAILEVTLQDTSDSDDWVFSFGGLNQVEKQRRVVVNTNKSGGSNATFATNLYRDEMPPGLGELLSQYSNVEHLVEP